MDQVFWLHDNFIGGRPGPNLIPWNLPDLKDAGIGAILSVNDGALIHADDLSALDINYRCTPLSENAPPREGDMETCSDALAAEGWEEFTLQVLRDC